MESDYSLLLEVGRAATHCSGVDTNARSSCITGFNLYNRNVLDTIISPGTYTLWLYQPNQILGNCSLFEFSLSVTFVDEESQSFKCQGPRFPGSLNEPNFINNATGYLHLQDTFLVDLIHYTQFTIFKKSYFKVSGSTDYANNQGFALSLFFEADGSFIQSEDTLFRSLEPGNYSLFITSFDMVRDDKFDCPAVDIELAIVPEDMAASLFDNSACPFPAENKKPELPTPLGDQAYHNSFSEAFVAFRTGDIATYPITVSSRSRLIAAVDSSFLLDDIRLELRSSDGKKIVRGDFDYNRYVIDETFNAGKKSSNS